MAKRIIPCLDVKEGRVVKGVGFLDLKDAGDPAQMARFYDETGADELVFLDITASVEGRHTILEVAERIAREIKIPFIVGGGINSLEQIHNILKAGADKVSLGTAALENTDLIAGAARSFGSRHLVVAIDVLWNEGMQDWEVYSHGGRKATGLSALAWAKKVENLGAGEILLTSMDADGARNGFNIPLTAAVAEYVGIPVIASGGAGKMEHFAQVLTEGKAEAALAASVFHYGHISIQELKQYLQEQGVEVFNLKSKEEALQTLAFDKHELLPAIIQDSKNNEVLMLAYMNRESFQKTLQTGLTWFWSRSRGKLWQKGESSGNIQRVQEIFYDCDEDTLLVKVDQTGPACHTGARSCFYRKFADDIFKKG